ncbi:alpha/beta hydrolase [Rhizobium alvei]|uniref:Alpha/beta hydrolase n=1 Tax=Rhizobium alvei TaxID=1132659 RepID=A0ABT8YGY2_9HYPH|nr:alpha/beta hydrolase [Rhizobium alvei]MDO6962927.1 alpha/beta hydrolase [Rhizobium alvei]
MTDYKSIIDAETWAFIDRTNSYYPPDAVDYSIERQREVYNTMCREFHHGYPEGISAENKLIHAKGRDIPARRYRASRYDAHAVVLYFHGGGFVVGGLESHDDVCADICARTHYEVISVDYRLAPEFKHPAAFEDALAGFEWVAGGYDLPIILAGDSAGGNLAAAVAHATRNHKQAAIGQVLIYPGLGGGFKTASFVKHAEAPMLTARDIEFYQHIRGEVAPGDVTAAPLQDTDFSHLPPTIVITAECDPLSSDGEIYGKKIRAAGGKAWWHEEAGLVHGYLRARHTVARARESFTRIVEAIKALGHGEWHHP